MQQGYLFNLTRDIGMNKQQRYAILSFLKIDRQHGNPCQGSHMSKLVPVTLRTWLIMIDQRQVTNQVCGVVPMYEHYQA